MAIDHKFQYFSTTKNVVTLVNYGQLNLQSQIKFLVSVQPSVDGKETPTEQWIGESELYLNKLKRR
jgi:hypothetical protein